MDQWVFLKPGFSVSLARKIADQEKEYFAKEYDRVQDEMKTRKNEKGKQVW